MSNEIKHPHAYRYNGMLGLCYQPSNRSFHLYGARGIRVDWEWDRDNPLGFHNYTVWLDNELREFRRHHADKKFVVTRRDKKKNFSSDNCIVVTWDYANQHHCRVKLNLELVIKIREYARTYANHSLVEIGAVFNINKSTVFRALSAKHWKEANSVIPGR